MKHVFLYGHLHETFYMKQLPGFRDHRFPDHVCLSKDLFMASSRHLELGFIDLLSSLWDLGLCIVVTIPLSSFTKMFNIKLIYYDVLIDDILLTASST